jgi:hypothetical protein
MTNTPTPAVKIVSRWDANSVLYEATPPADLADANQAVLLGWAVKKALESDINLGEADLSGAYLSGAYLREADLSGANLRWADLSGAYLRWADLSGANLRWADLSGANLGEADLRWADLREADLSGANLGEADIPLLPNIDAAILEAVEKDGNKLDMSEWHVCRTTHCRAGWAIHLCGDAGYALEKAVGSSAAGALIYAKSRPDKPIPNFMASDEDALADMRACAAGAAK